MRSLLGVPVLVLGLASSAAAGPILWTLDDVRLEDGATVTGSFVADLSLRHPGSFYGRGILERYFAITVTGGLWPDFEYSHFNAYAEVFPQLDPRSNFPDVVFARHASHETFSMFYRYLGFDLPTPLSDAGGVITIVPFSHAESLGFDRPFPPLPSDNRYVISGRLVGTPTSVPEPSIALLLVAAAATVLRRRHRTGRTKSAGFVATSAVQ
jgi:hypothetical protein